MNPSLHSLLHLTFFYIDFYITEKITDAENVFVTCLRITIFKIASVWLSGNASDLF